jgi:ketosteroid isomerase-like protein
MEGGTVAGVHAALRRWFEELQACVRDVDFAAGRALFADDVVAFGTRADVVTGLDALVASQWRPTWPNITDFAFRVDQLHTGHAGDLAWGVIPWTSTGYHPDGSPFERPGRATLIFVRRAGRWLAKHSHFSLNPGTPPTSHRPRR